MDQFQPKVGMRRRTMRIEDGKFIAGNVMELIVRTMVGSFYCFRQTDSNRLPSLKDLHGQCGHGMGTLGTIRTRELDIFHMSLLLVKIGGEVRPTTPAFHQPILTFAGTHLL
ncbi:conserved hypothetical protein [Ricinus communis]|uniref:Uncharacterized protein n=1 Tax=Ricinus communis TaxID=3988 RepID=B9R9Q1_RICCO|nr:conserved hypothetical protein [Ricinus communis]